MNKLWMLVLLLAGCELNPKDMQSVEQTSGRFRLIRVETIRDKLAYDGSRGIYVLTDTESGKTFVGISGIGISELSDHRVWKTSERDER